jgi:hypothetical protein
MPEVPPGPYGGGLSGDEIAEAAARAAREITAGLAVDVMNIEQELGQDPQSATKIGSAFAEQIAQGLDYSVTPVLRVSGGVNPLNTQICAHERLPQDFCVATCRMSELVQN